MKLKSLMYIVLTACLLLGSTIPTTQPRIKSIEQAEFSTRNEPRVSREVALSEKVNLVEMFNEVGKLESYTRYDPEGSVYESTDIEWTKDSLIQTSTTVNGKGELIRIWKTTWESKGKLSGATNTDSHGNVTAIQTNTYDDEGNMIQTKMENPANGKISTTDLVYNNQGRVIEKTEYNPYRDRTDKRTYQYDGNGLESVQELFKGNGDYTKFISEYDEKGNLLEMYWYNKEGEQTDQTSFTYDYDETGNWITKTRGSNGDVTYVWERKIEYW